MDENEDRHGLLTVLSLDGPLPAPCCAWRSFGARLIHAVMRHRASDGLHVVETVGLGSNAMGAERMLIFGVQDRGN